MKKRGSGVIINDIGNSGENWDYNYVAGSTGNAALMSFTKAVGGVSLDYGVRVVGVNPGPIATDRMVRMMKRRARDNLGDEARWQEYLTRLSRRAHGHGSGSGGPDRLPRFAAGRLHHRHDRHNRRRHRRLRLDHQAAAEATMSSFAAAQRPFRSPLCDHRDLFWLGQNTNHLPMHPAVRKALIDAIDAEEFHAYAPPGGFTALLDGIVADLGLPHETTAALVTDGAVAALGDGMPRATANRAPIS